jgi:hypothetical protein
MRSAPARAGENDNDTSHDTLPDSLADRYPERTDDKVDHLPASRRTSCSVSLFEGQIGDHFAEPSILLFELMTLLHLRGIRPP